MANSSAGAVYIETSCAIRFTRGGKAETVHVSTVDPLTLWQFLLALFSIGTLIQKSYNGVSTQLLVPPSHCWEKMPWYYVVKWLIPIIWIKNYAIIGLIDLLKFVFLEKE